MGEKNNFIPEDMAKFFESANRGRDYDSYTFSLDAAIVTKARSIFPHFGVVAKGSIIVDAGSGTGLLAEYAASIFRGVTVYALDFSHELLNRAKAERALARLVMGDASCQVFPENSVDVKFYSTSGHEIESFGGSGRMINAIEASFKELKHGGRLVIRDFAKPSRKELVYMRIFTKGRLDDFTQSDSVDYGQLSTEALFEKFHKEFQDGNAFEYEIVNIDGQEYIKILPEWAHEFYLRKDYTANWKQEIHEKYTYWTQEEARENLLRAGYTDVEVILDPNEYILKNRLQGKIALFELDSSNNLVEIPFPTTHIVIVGVKPKEGLSLPKAKTLPEDIVVDYEKLKKTINYDKEKQAVTIGSKIFLVTNDELILGSKKVIYRLQGEPSKVLKVVRTDQLNDHAMFKAMYQSVAREYILDWHNIPHTRVLDIDPEGPPYRYCIQESVTENSTCAAKLIQENSLTETDIVQMAGYINRFELSKEWQLDTNPYNWYKVTKPDGLTQMIYVDGKVYPYDEDWKFIRVGLLQWINAKYVTEANNRSAVIPKEKEYEKLVELWNKEEDNQVVLWKKYLASSLQPV